MNPSIQPGTHPDAEALTAFAERLLGDSEQEQMLAHMAVCSRCRKVVFLAQQALDAEPLAQVPGERVAIEKAGRGWLGGWHWAWIPVAALAGFVGIAVVQHIRHAALEQQTASNVQQTERVNGAAAAKATNSPAMQQAPKRDESETLSAARQSPATPKAKSIRAQESARALDEKKVAGKDESKQSADAMNGAAGAAGGAMHGTLTARANSFAIGGPMAQNQMQQGNAARENASVQTQAAASYMANKPMAAIVPATPARSDAVSESADVQAMQQAVSPAPVSAPGPQMEMVPVTGGNLGVASADIARLKAGNMTLPSGLGTLSVATVARRAIAIDTAGTLFLSQDGGKHWQPVQAQWSGRAVLVRTRQKSAAPAVLSMEQTPQFELVNDKLLTWLSVDGKSWTAQTLPGK